MKAKGGSLSPSYESESHARQGFLGLGLNGRVSVYARVAQFPGTIHDCWPRGRGTPPTKETLAQPRWLGKGALPTRRCPLDTRMKRHAGNVVLPSLSMEDGPPARACSVLTSAPRRSRRLAGFLPHGWDGQAPSAPITASLQGTRGHICDTESAVCLLARWRGDGGEMGAEVGEQQRKPLYK